MRRRTVLKGTIGLTSFALGVFPSFAAQDKVLRYSQRPDVKRFIADVANRRGLTPEWIASVLDEGVYQPKVEKMMTPKKIKPGTKLLSRDWNRYRDIFLGAYRINLGTRFWKEHKELLLRAQKEFGVDPAVIVGIIGVETRYGENTGNWRVLDALVTLSFDYKRRADFFKKELEEFLVILKNNNLKSSEVLGSYAGAIGIPQFMPSSIKRFGVDFDGDGKIDINNSVADTIGSIANFLAKNGWVSGLPMILQADVNQEHHKRFGSGLKARYSLSELEAAGLVIHSKKELDGDIPVFVVDLPYYPEDSAQNAHYYKVGTRNFSSVLHYNPQYFYAAAVAELGSAVAKNVGEKGLIY
jgi:membrane-bound lytic murein transglycosylase B